MELKIPEVGLWRGDQGAAVAAEGVPGRGRGWA